MNNDQRIAEIAARCEAATPGPWFNFGDWIIHTEPDVEHNGIAHSKTIGTVKAENADFIARSRTLIPELCDALGKAKEKNAQLVRELAAIARESVERDMELAKLEAEVMVWAKAERDKGCEHCKVLTAEHCTGFLLPSADPDCEADMVTISHCPMCGKRLEVEP